IDDNNIFIGIIRRREIIEYFTKNYISTMKDIN
ncbi:MAG TPA: CBS domain-containing protein, partial [Clostridiaceae bacterium]|nr:CBS domain-containing protein [Clostridiaceae bacterium]